MGSKKSQVFLTVLVRKTDGARKRGRPREKCADIVNAHAGGAEALQDKLADQVKWRTAVKHYFERRRRQFRIKEAATGRA